MTCSWLACFGLAASDKAALSLPAVPCRVGPQGRTPGACAAGAAARSAAALIQYGSTRQRVNSLGVVKLWPSLADRLFRQSLHVEEQSAFAYIRSSSRRLRLLLVTVTFRRSGIEVIAGGIYTWFALPSSAGKVVTTGNPLSLAKARSVPTYSASSLSSSFTDSS